MFHLPLNVTVVILFYIPDISIVYRSATLFIMFYNLLTYFSYGLMLFYNAISTEITEIEASGDERVGSQGGTLQGKLSNSRNSF